MKIISYSNENYKKIANLIKIIDQPINTVIQKWYEY